MKAPIRLFHTVDDKLATGAQPAARDLGWLREQGFDAVVNLNLPTARNYLPEEASLVEGLGMKYVALPIDCSRLSEDQYLAFQRAMESLPDARVFVHCAANIKSSGFVHVYRVKGRGEDPKSSLEALEDIGAGHEPKWHAWFERMGAA